MERRQKNAPFVFTDIGRMLLAVLVLRVVAVVLVIFTLPIRPTLPLWMLEWFGRISYPLILYSLLLLLFHKKTGSLLNRHPWLLYLDLLISVAIIQIGGSWRSSYFGYTITTMILFTIFKGRTGAYISAIFLIIAAVIKDPSGGLSCQEVFFVSDWDMRMGAALIYTTAGAILGYFSTLLQRLELLSKAEIEKTSMEAKTRLALELHDGAKQMVNAILLKMNPMIRRIQISQDESAEELRWLWKGINYLQSEMNQVMDTLRENEDSSAVTCNILSIVEEEVRIAEVMTSFSWHVTAELDEACIPRHFGLPLRRFISEALMNSWKHSGSTTGKIALHSRDKTIMLSIIDSGKGFNHTDTPDSKTTGINSLKYRTKELNGNLIINTAPGNGCRLLLTIPLTDPTVP
jgi:signal transduction histidine kinase